MSARDTRQPLVTAPAPATRSRWRHVLWLLTLVLLVVAVGLGNMVREQTTRLSALEQRLDGLEHSQSSDESTQDKNGQAWVAQQAQLHNLQGSVDRLNATLGGDQRRQWQLQEVSYYLHMAQQQLVLTHDVAGSFKLLDVASRILADSNDNDLMGLRQAVSNDQLALKLADHVDVAGIYLRLGALDQEMATLVLPMEAGGHRAEGVVQQPDAPAPVAGSGWQARAAALLAQGAARFRSLITVRHYDEPIKPLLSDAQRALIIENLRLHLGQAQLALLRGDASIYTASLKTAQADFERYFQQLPINQFKTIQEELAALAAQSVAPTVPPITSVQVLEQFKPDSAVPAAGASSGSMP